jgi:hypothetical protein
MPDIEVAVHKVSNFAAFIAAYADNGAYHPQNFAVVQAKRPLIGLVLSAARASDARREDLPCRCFAQDSTDSRGLNGDEQATI